MRTRFTAGSSILAVAVAAYFLISTLASSDSALLSPGLAAIAALIAALLLAANHAYLIIRSVAYCGGQTDGGRRWIARRRELVGHGSPQSGNGLRTTVKRIAFLAAELLLSPTAMIVITVAAVISLLGVLIAGLVETLPSETAGLAIALVPFALIMAGLVVARAVLAAVLFPGRDGPARPLVAYGRLPEHAPASLRRSYGVRGVAGHLVYPAPVATLLAAAAVPLLMALDLRGIGLGTLVGLLLVHLAVANWVLYVCSRRWWRQLRERLSDADRNKPARFPRGTIPPTQRVLVDVITPLGPNSSASEVSPEEAPAQGSQSIYDHAGRCLFRGEWDPRALYEVLAGVDWAGLTVLDIGANTCGLSLEIARAGARVTALEPAPYANQTPRGLDVARRVAGDEELDLVIEHAGIDAATRYGAFDVVLCLGLVYHFRDPQFILDHISSIDHEVLFVSTHTDARTDLALVNRRSPGVMKLGYLRPQDGVLSGWHPTRPLFERMLEWAGYERPISLTDEPYNFPHKGAGLTNTAYYRAEHLERRDPLAVRFDYYPR